MTGTPIMKSKKNKKKKKKKKKDLNFGSITVKINK